MINEFLKLTEIPEVEKFAYLSGRTKKSNFSKTKIYFHKQTTPRSLGHIGLKNMKVGVKENFG